MVFRSGTINVGALAFLLIIGRPALSFGGQHPDWTKYSNNLAPYVVAPEHAVDRMLSMARLSRAKPCMTWDAAMGGF